MAEVVKQLQGAGLPAVFVMREDIANISGKPELVKEKPASDQSWRSILARLRASELHRWREPAAICWKPFGLDIR